MTVQGNTQSSLLETPDQPGPNNLPAEAANAGLIQMIERLARDVDVDKLERLIAMQERIMRHNAKAAFDAAFAKMQQALPEIDERGKITDRNGNVRSSYAKLEDIHKAIKPTLAENGFAMRHRTEWPADKPGVIRIVGILSHEQGHSEESAFEAPMDKSDYRTDVQSMGSTVSYGRRYTTLDLLNISTRGVDDDGKKAGQQQAPPAPDGFEKWVDGLKKAAEKGLQSFEAAWECSDGALKTYAMKWHREDVNALKKSAAAVKAAR